MEMKQRVKKNQIYKKQTRMGVRMMLIKLLMNRQSNQMRLRLKLMQTLMQMLMPMPMQGLRRLQLMQMKRLRPKQKLIQALILRSSRLSKPNSS